MSRSTIARPRGTRSTSRFSARASISISKAVGPQAVSPGLLNLTLTNPLSIDKVVGTPYPDTILGNGRNDTLIGNGGDDYLNGRGGACLIEGDRDPSRLSRLPARRGRLLRADPRATRSRPGIGAIYSAFNFTFTQTQPASGPYETLDFNVPGGSLLAGEATELDWRNLDLGGSATIDISQFLGGPDYPADTPTNVINMSATIGAHELGHLSGLHPWRLIRPDRRGHLRQPRRQLRTWTASTRLHRPGKRRRHARMTSSRRRLRSARRSSTRRNVTFFGERDDIAHGVRRFGHGGQRDARRTRIPQSRRPSP